MKTVGYVWAGDLKWVNCSIHNPSSAIWRTKEYPKIIGDE